LANSVESTNNCSLDQMTIVGRISSDHRAKTTVVAAKDQTEKLASALNLYLVLYLGGTQLFLTFGLLTLSLVQYICHENFMQGR